MTIRYETRACAAFVAIDRPERRKAMAGTAWFASREGRGWRFGTPEA
ncbi:hypothetical protein L2D00_01625 [Hyphomonadaceae bacterium BL14]|nr:hypothetical protein L2D00_01625 [Hyphomonadaceae bacterium BL14]